MAAVKASRIFHRRNCKKYSAMGWRNLRLQKLERRRGTDRKHAKSQRISHFKKTSPGPGERKIQPHRRIERGRFWPRWGQRPIHRTSVHEAPQVAPEIIPDDHYYSLSENLQVIFATIWDAFADAAYANTHDRKSQYGLTFRLGTKSAHFYSVSKKQSIVAISSTEAEYVALAECVRDVIWLRSFLHELGYTQLHPTPIYQDNKSCIAIAENTGNTERTKHIDIRHHFLKDFIASNDIKLYYLPTDDMVADILTKSLVTAQFSKLANVLLKLEVLTSE